MSQSNLTAEQWQAIAEKLAEYNEELCFTRRNCDECAIDCLFINQNKKHWIEQAKKELGYVYE